MADHSKYELIYCPYADCAKQFYVDLFKQDNRARILAGHGSQCTSAIRKQERLPRGTAVPSELPFVTDNLCIQRSDSEDELLKFTIARGKIAQETVGTGIRIASDDECMTMPDDDTNEFILTQEDPTIGHINPTCMLPPIVEEHPFPFVVTDELQNECKAAEDYSQNLDRTILDFIDGQQDSGLCNTLLCKIELGLIIKRYSWSDACTKAVVNWINKYKATLAESQSFRLADQTKLLASVAGLSPIAPNRKVVQIAKRLIPTKPEGIAYTLVYRDPLMMIARRVTMLLHQYGPATFEVDMNAQSFEYAQDGLFLRNVWAQLCQKYGSAEPILLIPFNLYADGGHMRSNGLHVLTPFLISVLHRRQNDDCTNAELITTTPAYQAIAELLHRQDPAFPNVSRDLLMPSIYHGVMHHFSQHLALVINGILPFHVYFRKKRYQCFPILHHKGMDMPMMSSCSFTLMSYPRLQSAPCGQCLATSGALPQLLKSFFGTLGEPRQEHEALRYCFGSGETSERRRLQLNLRRLGRPAFTHMNPFDPRGGFLQSGVDGLHAFKGLWFRKLVSLALEAMYINSKRPVGPTFDGSMSDDDSWCAAAETALHSSNGYTQDLIIGLLEGDSDESESDSECTAAGNIVATAVADGNLMSEKNPARRATKILHTKRGRIFSKAADEVNRERLDRIGSHFLPMRGRSLADQVSQLQEHRYSPGLLLLCVVVFSSDISEFGLGRFRSQWLQVAVLVIRCYIVLFQRKPTEQMLQEARKLLEACVDGACQLVSSMDMQWSAPKLHCNLHFPENIAQLSRVRIFDTVVGEAALSFLKTIYKTISNRDVWTPIDPLLRKTEEYVLAESFAKLYTLRHVRLKGRDLPNQSNDEYVEARDQPIQLHDLPELLSSSPNITLKGGNHSTIDFMYTPDVDFKSHFGMAIHMKAASRKVVTPGLFFLDEKDGFWISIKRAICMYLEVMDITYPDTEVTISVQPYPTASIRRSDQETATISATSSRYSKRQFDFVRYSGSISVALSDETCTDVPDYGFGRCVLICRLSVRTQSSREPLLNEQVVFISPLHLHNDADKSNCAGKCIAVHPILIHGRVTRYASGYYALYCLPLFRVLERVTVLKDRVATWVASRPGMRFPNGEWYFIMDSRMFEGLEQYA